MTQIVVNPGDLRAMARLMRSVASDIEDASRSAAAGMPWMPPEVGPYVTGTVSSASWQLRQTARSIYIESAHLDNRAAIAEAAMGGGLSVGLSASRLRVTGRGGGIGGWLRGALRGAFRWESAWLGLAGVVAPGAFQPARLLRSLGKLFPPGPAVPTGGGKGTGGLNGPNYNPQGGGNVNLQGGSGISLQGPGAKAIRHPGGSGAAPAAPPKSKGFAAAADRGLWEAQHDPGPRELGFDKPGECVVSVRRWVTDAGGTLGGGGVVTMYTNSGAVQVPLAEAAKGDIIQYTPPGHENDSGGWYDGPVHTVMVVANKGVDAQGAPRFSIVQANVTPGVVSADANWTPKSLPDGWTVRVWRLPTPKG